VAARLAQAALSALAATVLATGCGGSSSPERAPAPVPTVTPPTGVLHLSKILTVVEENHSLQQMQTSMPYLFSLAQHCAYATDYTAASHPSLPNYLAISGGSTFGVTDDANPATHPISEQSVFGQALAAGKPAKVYAESMPHNCSLSSSGHYAVKHTGWAYYADERHACQPGRSRSAAWGPERSPPTSQPAPCRASAGPSPTSPTTPTTAPWLRPTPGSPAGSPRSWPDRTSTRAGSPSW